MPSHKQRPFFFAFEDEASKKGPRCCPSLGPPDHALRKVEALCAIRKANVTVALLFQTLIELKRKTGRAHIASARPVTGTAPAVKGVNAGSRNKRDRVHMVPDGKTELDARRDRLNASFGPQWRKANAG